MGVSRRSTLLRFTLSSLLVLLFPLVLMHIVVFRELLADLEQRAVMTVRGDIELLSSVIDREMDDIHNVALEIGLNERLSPFLVRAGPLSRREAIAELNRYARSNRLIWKLVLVSHSDDRSLLTNEGSYDFGRFFDVHFPIVDYPSDAVRSLLRNGSISHALLPVEVRTGSETVRSIALLAYPLPATSTSSYATVVFMVDLAHVQSLVERSSPWEDGNTILLSGENRVIASRRPVTIDEVERLLMELGPHASGSLPLRMEIDGKDSVVAAVSSLRSGWTHISTVPFAEVSKEISSARTTILISNILIVLAGSLLTFAITRFAYRPIQRLSTFARSVWDQGEDVPDDIESIRSVVTHMSSANDHLRAQVADSALALKEYLLLGMLKGQIDSIDTFNEKGRDVGLVLDNPTIWVAALTLPAGNDTARTPPARFIELVESNLPENVQGYGKQILETDHIPFLLATQSESADEAASSLELVRERIRNEVGAPCVIGLSRSTISIREIPERYIEAIGACEHGATGEFGVALFQDRPSVIEIDSRYPETLVDDLVMAVQIGDVDRSRALIRNLLDFFIESRLSLSTARMIIYELSARILRLMRDQSPAILELVPDTVFSTRLRTPEELIAALTTLAVPVAKGMLGAKESHNTALTDRVLRYIRENHARYDFSVASMAEALDVSQSYLSRFFRDQTGMTVTEYVTNLRMEQARTLLRKSEKSIHEVGLQVGYFDASSFIKRFKMHTGTTPGEFRTLYGCKRGPDQPT